MSLFVRHRTCVSVCVCARVRASLSVSMWWACRRLLTLAPGMTVCELIEQRISESLFASLKREQEVLQLCGRTVRNRVFALVRVGARSRLDTHKHKQTKQTDAQIYRYAYRPTRHTDTYTRAHIHPNTRPKHGTARTDTQRNTQCTRTVFTEPRG